MGTRSNDASVPGMDWVKGFISADALPAAVAALSSACVKPAQAASPRARPVITNVMVRFMLLPGAGGWNTVAARTIPQRDPIARYSSGERALKATGNEGREIAGATRRWGGGEGLWGMLSARKWSGAPDASDCISEI